ncbi:hypothetical protein ACE6H2_020591 [Prunus campanulata]
MVHYLNLDYGSVERERDLRGLATRSEHSPTLKSLNYRHGLPPIGSTAATPPSPPVNLIASYLCRYVFSWFMLLYMVIDLGLDLQLGLRILDLKKSKCL